MPTTPRPAHDWRATLAWSATVVAILPLFRVIGWLVQHLGALPPSAYEGGAFVDDALRHGWRLLASRLPAWLWIVVALAAVVATIRLAVVRRALTALVAGWNAVDEGKALRFLALGVTAITTWALSAYARNLYFDQLHAAERLLLVALWLAIAWRPLFVFPYAVVAAAIAGQFTVPLGFVSWTEMGVLLHFPVLLGAWWLARAATRDRSITPFVFTWCCVVAVTYVTSGMGKLEVDWLSHPHIPLLMAGAHANGWLSSAGGDVVPRVVQLLEPLAIPMMLGTLAVECGALLILARRWTIVAFLALAITFHALVAAMTGIVFWKWVVADCILLAFFLRGGRLERLQLFTPARFALSVAIIVAAPLWVRSENLTWFDTPLTYSLHYEGTDTDGARVALPAGFFRPYSDAIVLATFPYLAPHPQLTRAMGVTTRRDLASALVAARTPDEALALESRIGRVVHDSAAAASFDAFVVRVASRARCDAQRDPLLLRVIGAPRHLWTMPTHAALACGVPLSRVRVVEETSFYDGRAVRVVRRLVLRELEVAPTAPNAARADRGRSPSR